MGSFRDMEPDTLFVVVVVVCCCFLIKGNFPVGQFPPAAGSCSVWPQTFMWSSSRPSHTLMLNHLRLLPALLGTTRHGAMHCPAHII